MPAPSTSGEPEDLDLLRAECLLGSKVGIVLFAGLAAMTFREHGYTDLYKVWGRIMGGGQTNLLREGMRKLGIREDEPPAVQAAKYHFFSNNLGGLDLEYIEESPKKVWLRYRAPYQMMPSLTAIAMPATLRRHLFSSWHPRNRHYLGYPRLGWVYTKTTLEGDPYDEGYFIEYDHDITDEIADGSEIVERTPEYDPAKAPQLDPVEWPESRQLKARRNYAVGYVDITTSIVTDIYGELEARHMIEKTTKIVATQLGREWIRDLGITGSGLDDATKLVTTLLGGLKQPYQLERVSDRTVRILVQPAPPFGSLPVTLRQAYSSLYATAIRHISGRIGFTFVGARGVGPDLMELEDAGHWLY